MGFIVFHNAYMLSVATEFQRLTNFIKFSPTFAGIDGVLGYLLTLVVAPLQMQYVKYGIK